MRITVPVMLNLGVAFLLVAAARAAPPIQVALLSPVDCKVSSWSTWSACGEKCVPHADGKKNVRTHTRRVLAEPQNGGWSCPVLRETRTAGCNQGRCPVKCVVGQWTEWTGCTETCGGLQFRFRPVLQAAKHGGLPCPDTRGQRKCEDPSCAAQSDWEKNAVAQRLEHVAQRLLAPERKHEVLHGAGRGCVVPRGKLRALHVHHSWFGHGYGSAWCRDCLCFDGRLTCTNKSCDDAPGARRCSHVTCRVRVVNNTGVMTVHHARGELHGLVHHCAMNSHSESTCRCTCYMDPRTPSRRMSGLAPHFDPLRGAKR